MTLLARSYLKEMDHSHLELVLSWRNQRFIREVMYHDEKIEMEEHQKWFDNIQANSSRIVNIFYFDGQPLGLVQIDINEKNHTAKWGFYIGEPDAPRGMGKIMGYLAIEYIFETLAIRKLCAEVMAINPKSIHYHQKLGFHVEGILKEHVPKGNRFVDVFLLALFSKDWERQREDVLKQIEGWMI
ncbi:UDP-4-amino-4,6-dideoxy-N-acetyl-beta-L-altrosamine N-acetyltransferase [Lederbergia sp. NSJ-179]|uniref:UDP-4-amino-4, 6-dideoxy-N-acetyl-beta-L-altrosamine N-acetyltransferase n=1 Tax=Lederbergia sp. NSJ-179 TaxID=2931402 RepID=UPI001FD5970A|nr:UDP-4-amino-4,6-dideoxy-N-acetyl-beta-L-altrosamine N-acetyltransferase [Lederbergia sp. NSJ-179]MCJ7841375.1 UDP-4-amino-4,6-dideoxy-N-acetyl-beta-L-altrosamine N-acetyltransferase [Lederbergia sp. NSJ-179]